VLVEQDTVRRSRYGEETQEPINSIQWGKRAGIG
jgi:hypothetical protein